MIKYDRYKHSRINNPRHKLHLKHCCTIIFENLNYCCILHIMLQMQKLSHTVILIYILINIFSIIFCKSKYKVCNKQTHCIPIILIFFIFMIQVTFMLHVLNNRIRFILSKLFMKTYYYTYLDDEPFICSFLQN
jgi:hypothetical protein